MIRRISRMLEIRPSILNSFGFWILTYSRDAEEDARREEIIKLQTTTNKKDTIRINAWRTSSIKWEREYFVSSST